MAPGFAASSSMITGYEIVADPILTAAIAPLKAAFMANVGKPLTRDVQVQDVKRLQELGTVAMVRTGTKPYKEGAKLCYRVEANPVIRSIELSGLTRIEPAELLAEFTTKPGQVLDYAQLFTDLNRIPDLYLQRKCIMNTDDTDLKDVKVEDGRVSVKVREFVMGEVVIRGVSGSEADLVRHTFHVKKGEPVVRSQLLGSLCDVYQLSTVEDVDWNPRFDKAAGRVDIVLDVTPANTTPGAVTLKKEKGRLPQESRKADPKALSEL